MISCLWSERVGISNSYDTQNKTADPDKQLTHVSVARQKSFLRIRVENDYEGEILFPLGQQSAMNLSAGGGADS